MPEDKATIMREFVKAMAAGDANKAISYLTDDAVSVTPGGTFKGKEAIKGDILSLARNFKDMKVTEAGNGIIVQGDKAFFEHVLSATYQGKKAEFLAMCAYEFSGDKIKNVRSTYDRLLVAKQAVSGWPATSIVNMVVRNMVKASK
jgi:ketosteroid isomerase-like protein